MNEWIGEIILFIFIIGREYQMNKSKNKKVETHDDLFKDFGDKFDKMSAKVNLIESESSSHKENIHKMRNDLNLFMASTNGRFERSEKNQSVQLMLMSQLCEKQGINTEMAKFLMIE